MNPKKELLWSLWVSPKKNAQPQLEISKHGPKSSLVINNMGVSPAARPRQLTWEDPKAQALSLLGRRENPKPQTLNPVPAR